MNFAQSLHAVITPTVGHVATLFAFLFSIWAMVASTWGALAKRDDLIKSGRRAIWAAFGLMVTAAAALELALITRDYSLTYVVEEIDNAMPLYYRITSLWGGMNGSLLWWSLICATYSALAQFLNRDKFRELMPWVAAVCAYVLTFLTGLVTFATNPFEPLSASDPALGLIDLAAKGDGKGLNPLLQTYWMTIHPPSLYIGYIGFTIPFAFCIAALVTKRVDGEFLRATRRWTLFAWIVLGFGILLGAKWAYEELGWGGYWGWDPVENASFMPWIIATAYVHSVIIQEKRGMLKGWNVFLILLAFIMTYFGTFLTRSGVVQSVHAFGSGPVGWMLGGFIGTLVALCAYLVYTRSDVLAAENEVEAVFSREATFLYNNVGLLGFMLMVLTGTMFPVISEAVKGNKIVVGPPFFNPLAGLITLGLFILMGIGQLVAWRKTSEGAVKRNFTVPLWATGIAFLALEVLLPKEPVHLLGFSKTVPLANPWAVALWTSCFFVVAGIVWEYVIGTRAVIRTHKKELDDGYERGDGAPTEFLAPVGVITTFVVAGLVGVLAPEQGTFMRLAIGAGVAAAAVLGLNAASANRKAYDVIQGVTVLFLRNRRRYGGYVVHLGIVIVVAGIVGSSLYKLDKTVTLHPGETQEIGRGYTLTSNGLDVHHEPGYWRVIAFAPVQHNGKKVGTAYPEKRIYDKGEQVTTEVSIHQNAVRDFYTILESYTDPRIGDKGPATATIRVLITPMVGWLWAGGLVMVFGTAVAAWPAARRQEALAAEQEAAAGARVPAATAAGAARSGVAS